MKTKILRMLFPILLFPAFLEAQNANIPSKQAIETPKTMIFGRVIYEDTGKPVRRGAISLLKISAQSSNERINAYENFEEEYRSKTITDDNGEFRMEDIPAGIYYPKMDVAGVLNPNNYDGFYREGIKISPAKLDGFFERISVIEGVKEMPVLIRVKRGGAIGGRINYSDGEPAINVKVEILRKNDYQFEIKNRWRNEEFRTDDRGVYRFAGLPSGEYIVRIIEPSVMGKQSNYNRDDSELKTYYGNSTSAAEAKIIELALGEEKGEINITIPDRKTFKVSGIVLGKSNKKPVNGAIINFVKKGEDDILSYDARGSNSRSFSSDEKGNWSIIDLPAGAYIFTISPSWFDVNEEDGNQKKKVPKYAEVKREVVIDDKDLEGVIFELPIEARISGTLVFEDKSEIKDVYIYVYDEEKRASSSTSYNESTYEEDRKTKQTQWNFVISRVTEGEYFLNVTSFGGQRDFYVKSIKSGETDMESLPLQLKEGDEIKNIRIVLASDVGTIKGRIESDDKKSLKTLSVLLVSVDKPNARNLIYGTGANENGEFEFKVAPGEYFLIMRPESEFVENGKLKHEEWLRKFTTGAEKVKVKAGEIQTVTIKK